LWGVFEAIREPGACECAGQRAGFIPDLETGRVSRDSTAGSLALKATKSSRYHFAKKTYPTGARDTLVSKKRSRNGLGLEEWSGWRTARRTEKELSAGRKVLRGEAAYLLAKNSRSALIPEIERDGGSQGRKETLKVFRAQPEVFRQHQGGGATPPSHQVMSAPGWTGRKRLKKRGVARAVKDPGSWSFT